MPGYQSQEFLFRRIKELVPPHVSIVDAISEILNVSSDSAYRRIRNETPLILDEARQLCDHFHLSLDQLLNVKAGSTLFRDIRINFGQYNYEQYLKDILDQLRQVDGFLNKEIIYLSKDVPIFHNFYYKPLIAFRYFFWMKTMQLDPGFATRHFDFTCITPEIETLSQEVLKAYQKIPSTEIWNTESINSTISQIEFYKESGYFSAAADIKIVYEAVEETIHQMKAQAEYGCKFMQGENPQAKKSNFNFFYNRVVLGDNTILVTADGVKTVYLNYGLLNYITTKDETFCNNCFNDLQNLKRRSTMISQTSERQRNIFFGILLSKIEDRKEKL
jgi:hypothetical protein